MKFTLSWLKRHLDTDADAPAAAERLTAIGLEVEGIEDPAAALAGFTTARVIEAMPHPQADKLKLCRVETASGEVQVVCGAPNARTGLVGIFAGPGTFVPGTGITLKETEIRGLASRGMLCSERELLLSDAHDGIIDLPADTPVGLPAAQALGRTDPVIEIAITPNRGDCNGVRGIARDLAAAGLGRLKPDMVAPVTGGFPSPVAVAIDLPAGAEGACAMFAGRLIRGVRNGPSPAWLQDALRAVGLRPISALVDVTNFISRDRARPLHVFDAGRLSGGLTARLARSGETLEALDGETYALTPEMLVIADAAGPQGIAGVMGGLGSGCTEATTDVFIEAALFDPKRIAAAGRALGILSDARYRFERGVDPEFNLPGLEMATALILELCGGEASDIVVAGGVPAWRREIAFDPALVVRLTGVDLSTDEIIRILSDLGFECRAQGGALSVAPPSWRPDIHGAADLVEEAVRIAGLARVPSVPLPRAPGVARPVLSLSQRRVREARRFLAARGFNETINYAFVPHAAAALFGGGDEVRTLENPISADLDAMRPSLLPSLIMAASRNAARGRDGQMLFEIAAQYDGGTPGAQTLVAAGLRSGAAERHWQGAAGGTDAFAVKADALALLEALGAPAASLMVAREAPHWYHPGRSGVLKLGPKTLLARFGELHPRVLNALDLPGPAAVFEVFPDAIPAPRAKPTKARPAFAPSDFQAVQRDFAFLVPQEAAAGDLMRAVLGVDRSLITEVSVFDRYQGAGVPEGMVSLAITVRLQPADRTLTDPEIEAVAAKIIAAAARSAGARLRA